MFRVSRHATGWPCDGVRFQLELEVGAWGFELPGPVTRPGSAGISVTLCIELRLLVRCCLVQLDGSPAAWGSSARGPGADRDSQPARRAAAGHLNPDSDSNLSSTWSSHQFAALSLYSSERSASGREYLPLVASWWANNKQSFRRKLESSLLPRESLRWQNILCERRHTFRPGHSHSGWYGPWCESQKNQRAVTRHSFFFGPLRRICVVTQAASKRSADYQTTSRTMNRLCRLQVC